MMRVTLHAPKRTEQIDAVSSVNQLLDRLGLSREGHLVICNGTLVPGDARLDDADDIEIRPVISGG